MSGHWSQACDLKSAGFKHTKDAAHYIDWSSVKIIGEKNHLLSRKILEAINIHTRRSAMSRDQGYHLPPTDGTIFQPHKNEG